MIQYSTTHRTNAMTDTVTLLGSGSDLLIYTGSQPSTCATSATGTLLVTLPNSSTFGTVSSGVLTANAISSAAAGAAGTAGYWRLVTSGGTCIAQGSVGVSGSDLNFAAGVAFTMGETISVSSFTITATGA